MSSTVVQKPQLTGKLITTIAVICLGSLQFGYHMAELNSPESIISCQMSKPGKVPYEESLFGSHNFAKCIPLSPENVGLVTSIFSIGGLIGSFYIGSFADKLGRKKTSLIHCSIYFLGSMLNGLSNSYYTLLVGRFIAGLGAGAALVTTPIFINEIAPSDYRGFLGSMNQVSVNIGILFTQLLALVWCDDNNWRLLLIMGAVIALVNFLLIAVYVDESPMWLLNKGFSGRAATVLHKLRGGDYVQSRNEVHRWRNPGESSSVENDTLLDTADSDVNEETTPSSDSSVSLEAYMKSSEYRNSKIVATGILIFQQFCGINSIIFYGVSVLVAIFPKHAIFINCLISVVNVVVTFGAAPLTDKLGRKPLLLTSVSVMGLLTIIMGIGIISSSSIFSIVGTFSYITFFAVGLGPIPFLLVSEVTQPKAKALAQSWGTTMNWLATFIVGFLFPILKNSWIGGGVYFIFTLMCAISFVFIKYWIPETKGANSYEEVWGLPIRTD